MIEIEFDGQRFTGFTDARVSRSVEAASGAFSVTIKGTREGQPFKRGGAVKLFVDEELFLSGFIEQTIVTYNASDHFTTIAGRSKTGDLIDSHVDGKIELNPSTNQGFTLKQLANLVIDNIGVDITVDDTLVPDLEPFFGDSPFSGEVAEKAFEILERYARKRQVFLTNDKDGNLVFVRGNQGNQGAVLIHAIPPKDTSFNNILDGEISIDDANRFNKYVVHSQGNPTLFAKNDILKENKDIAEVTADVEDKEIRAGRIMQIQAENSTDIEDAIKRAQWEADVRKSRSLVYTYRVLGHSGGVGIYKPNRLIRVIDDYGFENDTELLIKDVVFQVDNDGGNTTELTLVRKNAFTLIVEEPLKDKASTKTVLFEAVN